MSFILSLLGGQVRGGGDPGFKEAQQLAMANDLNRILGYNFLTLLGAAVGLRLFIREEAANYFSGYGILLALIVLLLTIVNIISAVFTRVAGRRKAYLLGALLVPLVGLGMCATGVRSIPRIERTLEEPESTEPATARPA